MKVVFMALVLCAGAYSALIDDKITNTQSQWSQIETQFKFSNPNTVDLLSEEVVAEKLSGPSKNFVEDLVKDLFENLRDIIVNGNEALPPLDPLNVDQVGPFNVRVTGAQASLELNALQLDGLGWIILDDIDFSLLRLRLSTHVTIPWIIFSTDYEANARVAIVVSHKANGNIRLFLNRVEFGVDLNLGVSASDGGHLLLRNLDINLKVHDSHLQISGMTGSSLINSFINSIVQNISQDIIVNQLQEASALLSDELFDVVNDILKDFTLEDLIGN